MKKIFLLTIISFCAILKIQAQTRPISKDSLSGGTIFTKTKNDTLLTVKSSKQNLITDSTEKNIPQSRYYEVVTYFVVSKIKDSSFVKVEVKANSNEDAERWKQYLIKKLNASTPNNNKAAPGAYKVIVRFIESKDGYISDIRALTSIGYGMEAEVYRVIKKDQKTRWAPAVQDGNIIRTYRK